jgi:hypothetical protein
VLEHVHAVIDEVADTELVAVQRLVAPLQAEPEVIVNAICRLPPGVVARPVPALSSTHDWLLGKPRTPAMQELAQMIRLAVQHRRARC